MECNVPEKYVKLIQDIILGLSSQGARVAGGESNIFNMDVELHQGSPLSSQLYLVLMDVV